VTQMGPGNWFITSCIINEFEEPYSKMAENRLFFCLHVNWPLLPRFEPNTPLNSAVEIEATRAN